MKKTCSLGITGFTSVVIHSISEQSNSFRDFEVTTNDDGTLTITKYTGTGSDVIIPETIEGLKVTKIDRCAFSKGKTTGIISPNAIRPNQVTVGGITCDSETLLTSVSIPDSVFSIGEWAFAYNPYLVSVIIPNSVTIIGNYAFYGCRLKSVVLPANICNLTDDTFEYNLAAYYESQNRKAGTYIWSGHLWSMTS